MKLPAIAFSIWIYAAWFGCVFCAKHGWELESLFFPIITWVSFRFIYRPARREIIKILILCALGLVFDSSIYSLGGIHYSHSPLVAMPIWMVSLWFTFVPSFLPLSQALNGRFVVAAILGGVLGPLSYRAGETFGVLYLQSIFVVGLYSLFWALFFSFGTFWLLKKEIQNANS
jgi:hypothetical protein